MIETAAQLMLLIVIFFLILIPPGLEIKKTITIKNRDGEQRFQFHPHTTA